MEVKFDSNGFLMPYGRISIDEESLKSNFVEPFDEESSRHFLYAQYEAYTLKLRSKITGDLIQWINGSFITNTVNPGDIDFVNLIEYESIKGKEQIIEGEFISNQAYKKFGIDAYLLILYPEDHKFSNWTQSDLLYWNDWFTRSRMDRLRKRHPKGYIEINWGKV